MALTVNPNVCVGAPDTFRDEGLYAFRFDTDRDLREDVAFKVQFGAPGHADGGGHVQIFEVWRATGADALKGPVGELIISGNTGRVVKADQGCLAYAGLAPDLFATNGVGFGAFRKALWLWKTAPRRSRSRMARASSPASMSPPSSSRSPAA